MSNTKTVSLPCVIGDKVKANVFRPFNGHDATIYGVVIGMSKDEKAVRILYNVGRTMDFLTTDFGVSIFVVQEN